MTEYTRSYTPNEVLEIAKCMNDSRYFIKNILNINSPLVDKLCDNFTAIKNSSNIDEAIAAYFLWKVLFNQRKTTVIMSKNPQLFNDLIRKLYDSLPEYLTIALDIRSKLELKFRTGSRILFVHPNPNSLRGRTIDLLYIHDISSIDVNNLNYIFECALPTMYAITGRQFIISAKDGTFTDAPRPIFVTVEI